MAQQTQPWIRRLHAIQGDRSYAAIERRAGWVANSLATTVGRNGQPGATKGVRLAQALGVPVEWLFAEDAPEDDREGTEARVMAICGQLKNDLLAVIEDLSHEGPA